MLYFLTSPGLCVHAQPRVDAQLRYTSSSRRYDALGVHVCACLTTHSCVFSVAAPRHSVPSPRLTASRMSASLPFRIAQIAGKVQHVHVHVHDMASHRIASHRIASCTPLTCRMHHMYDAADRAVLVLPHAPSHVVLQCCVNVLSSHTSIVPHRHIHTSSHRMHRMHSATICTHTRVTIVHVRRHTHHMMCHTVMIHHVSSKAKRWDNASYIHINQVWTCTCDVDVAICQYVHIMEMLSCDAVVMLHAPCTCCFHAPTAIRMHRHT